MYTQLTPPIVHRSPFTDPGFNQIMFIVSLLQLLQLLYFALTQEDPELRRGKVLTRSSERIRHLEHLLASHGLHRDTRILENTARRNGNQF
jgi:hypothetical protein